MKNLNIDVKSLVCGLVLGVGVMLAMGATTSSSGRYQITSSGIYLAVIDSETGQVWAGNFIPQGNAAAVFKNCPQGNGDLFHAK